MIGGASVLWRHRAIVLSLMAQGSLAAATAPAGASVIARGHIEAEGLSGTWVRCEDERSGAWSETAAFAEFAYGEGDDLRSRWRMDRSGGVHPLDSAEARRIGATLRWLVRRGWTDRRLQKGSEPSVPPPQVTRETVATPAEGVPATIIISPDGSSLLSSRLSAAGVDPATFSNFRKAAHEARPFKIIEGEGPSASRIAISSYAITGRKCGRPRFPDDVTLRRPTETVPLHFDGDLVIDAVLNGQGPFAFLLDTGGHDVLTPQAAAALGLHAVGGSAGLSLGSQSYVLQNVRVRDLRVGHARLRNQHFFVTPLAYPIVERGGHEPVAGILGLEFLERFTTTIDYGAGKIVLRPRGARIPRPSIPMAFSDDIPLVDATFAGRPGTFTIDTGNSGAVIVQGDWAKRTGLSQLFRSGQEMRAIGLGGAAAGYAVPNQQLALAGASLPGLTAVSVLDRAGGINSTTEAGNLGDDVLSAFTVNLDYQGGRLSLERRSGWIARGMARYGFGAIKAAPDVLVAAYVTPKSPADLAGLKAGDAIIAVDRTPSSKLGRRDMLRLLTDRSRDSVSLQVRQQDGERLMVIHATAPTASAGASANAGKGQDTMQ